jgi:hypothetical protein
MTRAGFSGRTQALSITPFHPCERFELQALAECRHGFGKVSLFGRGRFSVPACALTCAPRTAAVNAGRKATAFGGAKRR